MGDPVEFDDSSVPTRSEGALEAEVDGELILLSPKDFMYFGAQGAGGPVWASVDGQHTVGQIIDELVERFQADPEVIRSETIDFLDALRAAALIEFSS